MKNGICTAGIASKLTQSELAQRSGVGLATIRRAEGGKTVSVPVLKRLASTLHTTIDALLNCPDQQTDTLTTSL